MNEITKNFKSCVEGVNREMSHEHGTAAAQVYATLAMALASTGLVEADVCYKEFWEEE